MPGWTTNGVPLVGANTAYSQLNGRELTSVDTVAANGLNPQTVAATMFQIAALAAAFGTNTATSTAGAATLNKVSGSITTEALTTAVGSTYSFVLTNSLILLASPAPNVQMLNDSDTTGTMVLTSVTNAAGSSTWVFTNVGSAALNGTMLIAFHI